MQKAFRSGDYDKAMTIAKKLLKNDTDVFDATYMLASIKSLPLPEYCNYAEAIELMANFVASNPNHEDGWVCLGEVQQSGDDCKSASETYRSALIRRPNSYHALVKLAILQIYSEASVSVQESQDLLNRAIQIDPKRIDAYYHLGIQKKAQGDIVAARILFMQAVQQSKEGPAAYRDAAYRELRSL